MTKPKQRKSKLPPHVIIRNGEWYVYRSYASKEFYADGTRKRVQVKRRCLPETAWRAEQIVQEIENERRLAFSEQHRPTETLGDYLKRFLAAKKGSIASRTYEMYEMAFSRFVFGNELEHAELRNIKPIMLQDHARHLIDGKGISPYSVREFLDRLRAALNQAVKWELLERNPVTGIILPKSKKKNITAMDRSQAHRLLAVCADDPTRLVFEFALETGMRPGEYLALRWSDVDLENRTVTVVQSVAQNLKGIGFEIKEPKTKGSRRIIDISDRLRQKLADHYARHIVNLVQLKEHSDGQNLDHIRPNRRARAARVAAEKLAAFKQYDLVFPASSGVPLSRLNLGRREFVAALSDAGLDGQGFTLYTLRHTCATLMLLAGVNVKVVADKLGHASVNITLDTYSHSIPAMRDDGLRKLSEILYSTA